MRSKVKFIKTKSEVPLVRFLLPNGKGGIAIVDTGSESTIFDPGFVAANKEEFNIKTTKDKINFVGIEKDSEHVIITAEGKLLLGGEDRVFVTLPILAVLMDLSHIREHFKNEYGTDIKIAALIGSDFLTKIKGKINFKEKTMSFDYGLPC